MQEHPSPIRVLLIERLEILRAAFCGLISQDHKIVIVGDSGNYDKVIPLVEETEPDILVLHLHAGDEDPRYPNPLPCSS